MPDAAPCLPDGTAACLARLVSQAPDGTGCGYDDWGHLIHVNTANKKKKKENTSILPFPLGFKDKHIQSVLIH